MKKHKKLLCIFSVILILVSYAPVVHAQEAETEEEDRTGAPYFYVESEEYGVDCFPLKKTNVKASIDGIIADIYVEQSYANEGTKPINANYVFPASTKVTIHGMKMQIGNQIVTATIKEKEEAEEEFEEAKSEGKSASMLSEETANVFSMDVANIMPGDEVLIELHYTELIMPADGTYQFVFPTVCGPRYVSPVQNESGDRDEWTATPYLANGVSPKDEYNIDVTVSSAMPITSITSSSHNIDIDWNENTTAHVTLADSSDYAGNRDFILDYKLTGEEIGTGLMVDKGEDENVFMLMIQPPERYEVEELPPREYIFVLDVSGSMSGFPLDTAKKLIKNLVSGLSETDTFNLILFSGTSYKMANRSVPATEENIEKAIDLVNEQSGTGGTELSEALKSALNTPADKDTARNIVIISDGYIYGESEVFQIVRENMDEAEFFSFGIGKAVNRNLIEGIATIGQGEPFIVTDEDEADEIAEKFRTYIQSPILTDIKVTFEGFKVHDIEPSIMPTLYASKPIVLLGKWDGEVAGTINITGKTGAGEYSQSISVADAISGENEAISYLWARKRVQSLVDYGTDTESDKVRQEVTQIGLDYTMITPYTSFIAVLDVVRNPDGEGTDVNQPLPLPLEVSNLAVGYRIGSEPEEIILFGALVILIFMPVLFKKRRDIQGRRRMG
ncbi:MAG: VIT and VWA domain-containing protein [Clostridiales bacterium]|nr:VIT and VWA domain-containing protein [Clostridiales bacterium]